MKKTTTEGRLTADDGDALRLEDCAGDVRERQCARVDLVGHGGRVVRERRQWLLLVLLRQVAEREDRERHG